MSNIDYKKMTKDKVKGEDDFEKAFSKVRGKKINMNVGKPFREKGIKKTPPMDLKSFMDKKFN